VGRAARERRALSFYRSLTTFCWEKRKLANYFNCHRKGMFGEETVSFESMKYQKRSLRPIMFRSPHSVQSTEPQTKTSTSTAKSGRVGKNRDYAGPNRFERRRAPEEKGIPRFASVIPSFNNNRRYESKGGKRESRRALRCNRKAAKVTSAQRDQTTHGNYGRSPRLQKSGSLSCVLSSRFLRVCHVVTAVRADVPRGTGSSSIRKDVEESWEFKASLTRFARA